MTAPSPSPDRRSPTYPGAPPSARPHGSAAHATRTANRKHNRRTRRRTLPDANHNTPHSQGPRPPLQCSRQSTLAGHRQTTTMALAILATHPQPSPWPSPRSEPTAEDQRSIPNGPSDPGPDSLECRLRLHTPEWLPRCPARRATVVWGRNRRLCRRSVRL